ASTHNRMAPLIEHHVPVRMTMDVDVRFDDASPDGVNVVAEIPGRGPRREEIVMLGAHLDSWHGGTGATDNAAGSAVVLEAVRILKTAGLKNPRPGGVGPWARGGEGPARPHADFKKDVAACRKNAAHPPPRHASC